MSKYADQLVEARKAKQLTREGAIDLLADLNMFGEPCTGSREKLYLGWQEGGCLCSVEWSGFVWAGSARVRKLGLLVEWQVEWSRRQTSTCSQFPVCACAALPVQLCTAGTLMVRSGDADGMVSGAMCTTANTIRPALQVGRGWAGRQTGRLWASGRMAEGRDKASTGAEL